MVENGLEIVEDGGWRMVENGLGIAEDGGCWRMV